MYITTYDQHAKLVETTIKKWWDRTKTWLFVQRTAYVRLPHGQNNREPVN